jgi:hypothetical protein
VRRRQRPESGVFYLRFPYTAGARIAAARARFRVVEERDEGEGLLLAVEGDRRDLGAFRANAVEAGRAPRRK